MAANEDERVFGALSWPPFMCSGDLVEAEGEYVSASSFC